MGSSVLVVGQFVDIEYFPFKVQNVQLWSVPNCSLSGMAFSGCETFRWGHYHSEEGRFADAQESLIQVAKHLIMGSVVMKGVGFAGTQES